MASSEAGWRERAEALRPYGMELIRIYLGVGLFLKGLFFVSNMDFLVRWIEQGQADFVSTSAVAHYVAAGHLCGGALLAVGLLTRLAALVQVPILVGAVFFVHLREGLFTQHQNLEFSALVLFLLLVLAAYGPGPLSLDAVLFRRSPGGAESPAIEPGPRR
ncbi:MAG: hypothetical protein KatS3mg102_0377 [Planctomycetota bacterium]|nr:MAG: hypothetical protein KatS3mg102_0377 [Planctomycetota bacterium]